ncbi:FAD linked oxidase-like [Oceanicola granulosus HTCC2516]|uniref:D-2-hydroxyglutarate dehydrogenase n=1 Tax=Oceanicola granulosus (strain ATCC BAA-861 / DSM 15982 / KCTC 12143 / HTCC2516) TaxID=314256 RepID=Q2CGD7_OCEGH|nr:FAD-binding and (Fe-S)-binding domain-containing protein [Oceanicola granulosus]EAR51781.1 FAD linked oxidase-like [Oceanicola granulosus HTCC2516]
MDGGGAPLAGDRLARFRAALAAEGEVELADDIATRIVNATDNSIYEITPAAVAFPRDGADLNRLMRAARASGMPLLARGGGTGTNGQSLGTGVTVDCSRHLTRILDIDPAARTAVVEPGVVLDDLNRAAAPHGLMVGPSVSTASRATLGGMVATDASGKGSRIHGRTSDHMRALDVVLSDGSDWTAVPLGPAELDAVCDRDDLPGALHRTLRDLHARHADEIARVFPDMNRGLTGYNLRDLGPADGGLNLVKLLAGSEGTLALTRRITLRLVPRPAHRALLVAAYGDALAALADAGRLLAAEPFAIEFLDDRILALAAEDPAFAALRRALPEAEGTVRGLNFVEVQADSAAGLARAVDRLERLAGAPPALVAARLVTEPAQIERLWALRARCVGLLGRMDPERQGTAFVEDCAVPPARLPGFVAGFREILDAHGLGYGMFGHADVGCLHVRPALDLRRPEDRARLRPVSDAVAALVRREGGVFWGEHGRGLRGEYGPEVFGPELWGALCEVKRAFDPAGLLNPGKIAGRDPAEPVIALDTPPLRGELDAPLSADWRDARRCNGNGQCFGRAPDDVMCPSYRATGDRLLSPKGRAALLRAWAREPTPDLARALDESLDACLSCRACASQCPVKVDIPEMKSRYRAARHAGRLRPAHHYLLAAMEPVSPLLRALPRLSAAALRLAAPLTRAAGLVDLPEPAPVRRPAATGVGREVVLLADTFLATYDGAVLAAVETVLARLGYRVRRIAPRANGKALHLLGMRRAFERTARRRIEEARRLAATGAPLLVVEPAVAALWRAEYAQLGVVPEVLSLERFLAAEIAAGRIARRPAASDDAPLLLPHCSESAADPESAVRWVEVMSHLGIAARAGKAGCCGMAGSFGHERANADLSARVYETSWAGIVAAEGAADLLATGFSCRCQVARMSGTRPRHPAELLARRL